MFNMKNKYILSLIIINCIGLSVVSESMGLDTTSRYPNIVPGYSIPANQHAMPQYGYPQQQQYMPQHQAMNSNYGYAPVQQQQQAPRMMPLVQHSNVNTSLLQRNSNINGQYPYRNEAGIATSGGRPNNYTNIYNPQASRVEDEELDPKLAKILESGEKNQEYIQRSTEQYNHKSNWFNKFFRIPTRQ